MNLNLDWKKIINEIFLNETDLRISLLNYVDHCEVNKIPVIINLKHLSSLTGINYNITKRIINSGHNFYYKFSIPKKNGGKRDITAPYPSVVQMQKWIVCNILSRYKMHDSATAYIRERSIIDHVQPHATNQSILVLDLENFFPSISESMIKDIFMQIGYPDHISYFLSRICTINNELPQGAPSSPMLSNFIGFKIDLTLTDYCKQHELCYTRYADDICISGNNNVMKHKLPLIDLIESSGFRINEKKTRTINGFGKKKIVTGISISSGKLRLPRNMKRNWRFEIYHIVTKGLENHMKVNNILDPIYLNRCIGKLMYWKNIEPNNEFVKNSLIELLKIKASTTD